MKTIGLIHGMSPVSTGDFYGRLTKQANEILGGHEVPEIVMASVNFAVIDRCVQTENWPEMGSYLAAKARALEAAGADFLVIGSNTGHQVADAVEAATPLPLLHIGDVVAQAATDRGASTVGLLGTKAVTEGGYFRQRLSQRGLTVVVPDDADRNRIHSMVFDELTRGVFLESSRQELIRATNTLVHNGADVVVLGCTEFSLLVSPEQLPDTPMLDTTELYVDAVVREALA